MGRPPKVRVSYMADASYIVRLLQAIEADETRPAKWRRGVCEKLNGVVAELLQAPAPGPPSKKKAS